MSDKSVNKPKISTKYPIIQVNAIHMPEQHWSQIPHDPPLELTLLPLIPHQLYANTDSRIASEYVARLTFPPPTAHQAPASRRQPCIPALVGFQCPVVAQVQAASWTDKLLNTGHHPGWRSTSKTSAVLISS